jgi:hypothetical protein
MESVRCGITGIKKTVTRNPASVAARTVSSRACAVGVPGSMVCCNASSKTAIDIAIDTDTSSRAARRSGRSRRSSVPFVRTENGVPDEASASMTPGISRYRPSAR